MLGMIKILIIEDDQRVAELLKRGLEEFGYECTVAFDGEMGLRIYRSVIPDLVISDVILPKMNGFELVKEIKKENESVPVLMLTALGATDDKLEGFDSGADDYMVKPFDIREIDARIRILLKRSGLSHDKTAFREIEYADLKINLLNGTVIRAGKEIKLTPKEFSLLLYMMQNPDRVLSRVEIAEKVWNTNFDTGTNFIDVYINYLRNKIDKGFDTKLIRTKTGVGFIFTSDDENKD